MRIHWSSRWLLVGLVMSFVIAACGDGGGTDTTATADGGTTEATTGGGGTTEATEATDGASVQESCDVVDQWKEAPSEWTGPTSAPTPPEDIRVALISVQEITEGSARATRAAKEAAEALGWEADILDGQGTTDGALAAINAAVDGGYDAMTLTFIDPSTVSEAVNRALDAGMPVVTLGVPPYTDERAEYDQIPDSSHDWILTGEIIGHYMICRSEGDVNALLLNGAETVVVLHGQFAGTHQVLTDPELCPGCEVTEERFSLATIDTQTPELAVSGIQADPDLNWVWCYDFCMAQVATRLQADGLADRVLGAGFDCNAQNIQLIQDGVVQVVCIADPRNWEAWATIDIVNRLLGGEEPVQQDIPVRLFDDQNTDEFTEEDIQEGWQGGFDFRSEYLRIWGVES
jgi:ribose transport system substrate-binding protein